MWGYQPNREVIGRAIVAELDGLLSEINPSADLPNLAARAGGLLDAASLLGITLDLWQQQNRLLDAYAEMRTSEAVTPPLQESFVQLAQRLNFSPDLLGWRP